MTLLSALAWGSALSILAIAIAAIAIPFHVAARAALDDADFDGALHIQWCWGLLRVWVLPGAEVEVSLAGRVVHRRSLERSRVKKGHTGKKKSGPSFGVFLEHWGTLAHIVKRLFDALSPDAAIWGRVGLSRPDHTAYLHLALRELDAAIPGVAIDIDADFVERSTLLRGVVNVFVWPVQLIALAIELVSRRDTRRLIQALR
jgi:hypothetical protein